MKSIWNAKYLTQRDMLKNIKCNNSSFIKELIKTKIIKISTEFFNLQIVNNQIMKQDIF